MSLFVNDKHARFRTQANSPYLGRDARGSHWLERVQFNNIDRLDEDDTYHLRRERAAQEWVQRGPGPTQERAV